MRHESEAWREIALAQKQYNPDEEQIDREFKRRVERLRFKTHPRPMTWMPTFEQHMRALER